MARARTDMAPPLLGSALLHGALVLATLISWPWGRPVRMDASVPVTLVANAPVSNVRPAEQAPEEALALTETPEPEAPPDLAAPPEPQPPQPAPKPAPVQPAPKKAKPAPALDLDALAESLKPARAAGKPKSSASRGASRAETAVQARPAVGQASALAASALSSLGADLARRWNPNCEVEGGADVDIRVAFRLDSSGNLVGRMEVSGENSANLVVKAAADRAKRAVLQAEPFQNLPEELYGDRIIVRFNARNACASG